MKKIFVYACIIITSYLANLVFACTTPASHCADKNETSFPLIENSRPAQIIVETTNDVAVQRVAKSFADDLKRLSGRAASLKHDKKKYWKIGGHYRRIWTKPID